ncbi:MAG TPA: FHA domain-containing protein [Thermoanaerobaculia bacterium]|nr:FHA domain-containing protein [Thermoanaerobaculia bacterium]
MAAVSAANVEGLSEPPESWRVELPGRAVLLPPGETTIGRSRGCGVVLADPCVSRVHALVSVRSGRALLQDLRSSNGTFVNGIRMAGEQQLAEGDRITIGNYDLVVRRAQADDEPLDVLGVQAEEGAEPAATVEMDRLSAEAVDPRLGPRGGIWQRLAERLRS